MRSEFLPFSRPSISEDDILAVSRVLRSGWITSGPQVQRLEQDFSKFVGVEHAIAVTSATAGLHIVLCALGIGPGDEVITPSMTWVSTVNLITLLGATPIFVDVDRDTLMAPPEACASAITPRTRAVVPVHFAGAAADLRHLRDTCAAWKIPLIEDAAHALGTEEALPLGERRHIGACGTAIYSFHPIKNITTGEGGMVATDDPELATRLRRLRFHGLGVDAHDREVQGRSPQAEVQEPGWKYNLTDIQAALGVGQLARAHQFIARRTALSRRYHELLEEVPEIRPLSVTPVTATHAWHLFVVRLDSDRITRADFMSRLQARKIGTGIHFRAVHRQKYYREALRMPPGALPNTEWNSERVISLPLFPDMSDADVEDVVAAIRGVLAEVPR